MLNREEIEALIKKEKLVEGYIDLKTQLTPNGFDLTCAQVFEFDTQGQVDFSNKERLIPEGRELLAQKESSTDSFGWWDLPKGTYKVKTNESVNLPNDIVAFGFSRTSLLRSGVFTQHGVWDAGFRGRSEFVLVVENPFGLRLKQNARVAQLVFFPIRETQEGYQGRYQDKR